MASATPQRVPAETVQKAIDALLKWRSSKSETQKPKLFDADEEFLYLILTLKKVPPKGRENPHKIPLPHSFLSPFSEHCLIIDDRPKSKLTKDAAQKKIKAEEIPISKVLKLSKLASDYRPFEAKRKLCNSYDMFLTDRRVVTLLPRLLGKQFFRKKKIPVPLDLTKKNWKEQVEKAYSSALLVLRTGTCSVVKVAKVGMERDQIVENVVAAINGIAEIVPKKWGNVRSFHLKLLESLALPIYQTVPDVKLRIEVGKSEGDDLVEAEKKGKEEEGGEGRKKKGRIHEVRYMDSEVVGEDGDGDESGSDFDGGDEGVKGSEDEVLGSGGLVCKKRKKGVKKEKGAPRELSIVKKLKKSAKDMSKESSEKKKKKEEKVSGKVKEILNKKSKNSNLSVGPKKAKKSAELKKLKGADAKLKVKISKKTA